MKKLISLLLVVLMLASLSVCAFADGKTYKSGEGDNGGGETAGAAADNDADENAPDIIALGDSSLTEEQQEAGENAQAALDAIEDLKAEVPGVAEALGDGEYTLSGLYYVKADSFPAVRDYGENAPAGVLFFGEDGNAAISFTAADGTTVSYAAEGWYCDVWAVDEAP